MPTDKGIHLPDEPYVGLGIGIFKADKAGHISSVVVPGDAAPGGGKFDIAGEFASGSWVNDEGDIVFDAHVAGQETRVPGFPPQASFISALGSLYFKDGETGHIKSIAHAGDPAPGGGVFRQALFGAINNKGDILFTGDLTPAPNANQVLGVFLYSHGKIISIARPGDAMPGGGHLVTASVVTGQTRLNNNGDVVFNAALDTDVFGSGTKDTGLFQWSQGHLSLIARTGTVLPGVGTVKNLVTAVIVTPPPPILVPNSGAVNNDRGQVLFGATLTDGRNVLLLDTPEEKEDGDGQSQNAAGSDSESGSGRHVAAAVLLPLLAGQQGSFFTAFTQYGSSAQVESGPSRLTTPTGREGSQQPPRVVAAHVHDRVFEQMSADFPDVLAADSGPLDT